MHVGKFKLSYKDSKGVYEKQANSFKKETSSVGSHGVLNNHIK